MSSLYVDRRGVALEYIDGAIVFRENGERIGTVPLAPIDRVFLRGEVHLTASLLGRLGEQGVGVVILSGRRGRPTLMLARPHNDARRRVAQIRNSLDPSFCQRLARDLIDRKLDRQIEMFTDLRDRHPAARYELTRAMKRLAAHRARLPDTNTLPSLRGIEGAAAACYFQGLQALLPPTWGFHGRNRRPPRDPFNALLSLTYTLAHAEIAIALIGGGFDPYVGFYHGLDFARESLAADLLEPVRPFCDRFCIELTKTGKLTPRDDFHQTSAGCMLGKAGRARYYAAYEAYGELLRAAITQEIDRLAETLGVTGPNANPETSGNPNAANAASDDATEPDAGAAFEHSAISDEIEAIEASGDTAATGGTPDCTSPESDPAHPDG